MRGRRKGSLQKGPEFATCSSLVPEPVRPLFDTWKEPEPKGHWGPEGGLRESLSPKTLARANVGAGGGHVKGQEDACAFLHGKARVEAQRSAASLLSGTEQKGCSLWDSTATPGCHILKLIRAPSATMTSNLLPVQHYPCPTLSRM